MARGSPERLLLLETSGRSGAVAVAAGDRLLESACLDEGRRNARDLAPTVARLLGTQGWTARDLDAVFVSRGPGSYTGLRVGLMSAKTLAYATGCALIGIDTFAVIADQAPAAGARLEVIADAQKDNVYAQAFHRQGERWLAAGELAIVSFARWLTLVPPGAAVSGPGLTRWRSQLPEGMPVVEEAAWHPGVASLLRLGLARLRDDERDSPFTLEPLYLRPSSAEQQWQARGR